MLIACRKRPVPVDVLREAVERIERDLFMEFEDEIPTRCVGERVLEELASIDTVAYIRFASVYREFDTVDDFAATIKSMKQSARARAALSPLEK